MLSVGVSISAAQAVPIGAGVAFDFSVTVDAEYSLTADGLVEVTVHAPTAYASYDAGNGPGVFLFDTSDLQYGSVYLVPPQIITDGTPEVPETLTYVPPFAVDAEANLPVQISVAWHGDGEEIPGAESGSYTLSSADEGAAITLVETSIGPLGTVTSTSDPVAVPAPPSGPTELLDDEFGAADGYSLGDDIPATSLDWTTIYTDPDIAATVDPLGIAEFIGDAPTNRNIRVGYAGVIGSNQAIEMTFDGVVSGNRADPVVFVRRTGSGTADGSSIRAFFVPTQNQVLFGEFSNNAAVQEVTISSIALAQGDVIRVEAVGTTATLAINGFTRGTLTGVAVTGGVPGFGGYVGTKVSNAVRWLRAVIEDLGS